MSCRADYEGPAQSRASWAMVGFAALAIALPLAGIVQAACAHAPSPLVVSGETLDAAGVTFEAVAAGMQSASDAHTLTAEQVHGWNDFLARWKAGYHGACALWRAAVATKDDGLASQALAVLATLLSQLDTWQVVVKGVPS